MPVLAFVLLALALPAAAAPEPNPAALAKLAQGDRAFLAGDRRGALFAYQDAVYLEPASTDARVKLGRAYLALRHPEQAQAQAEQVLAVDPGHAEARRLLEDARTASRPVEAGSPPAGPSDSPASSTRAPRVYRLQPEAAASSPATRIVPAAATGVAAPPSGPAAAAAPRPVAATTSVPAAAQRYRAGLELIGKREWASAILELNEAISQDPRLGVAYAARASAQFGLAQYREAADDYQAALGLQPDLATPIYGLAECYRLLGDRRAAETYRHYAESRAPDVREDLRAVAARRADEQAAR
jgi:tetratricopeptide (TPR) repeat protein